MSEIRRLRMPTGQATVLAPTFRPSAVDGPVADVMRTLADVRERGDSAVIEATRRFECPDFAGPSPYVPDDVIQAAMHALSPSLRDAITFSAAQVRAVAEAGLPTGSEVVLAPGQSVRVRVMPVGAAGVYVPGGRAAYPSSLIMGVVPAQVAGVDRIVVATPAGPHGTPDAVVLAAAGILGVTEVVAAGGAAAIGAMAYGTETIRPVDVITGPGNPWVQEAKRQVFGIVGIDSIAGPSELLVVADISVNPAAIAADLLAQAEHGADSSAVCVAWDSAVNDAIAIALSNQSPPVGTITLVDCSSQEDAIALAEAFAPEHLQLALTDAEAIAPQIRRAGCVFLGPLGATAFGDYVAGSNHILPTGGAARHASAVGPTTYMRRMAVVDIPQGAVDQLAPYVSALADAEGFPEHRRSAEIRTSR
ncbi:MAG: histidinol dehydrogenase [Thermoleophilia bacterium]|nr:histidinol dehydrogenase [Thermoleophilia bacterium]